jgi:hypothetical protein
MLPMYKYFLEYRAAKMFGRNALCWISILFSSRSFTFQRYLFQFAKLQSAKMHFTTAILGLTALASQVAGHGLVTKPVTRTPGTVTAGVCGKTMVDFYKSDNTSYPEALIRAGGLNDKGYAASKCNLWLCKGFQFADNSANVQKYKPGDVIDMEVYIRIPHKGWANVSVVDTVANKVIGAPLLTWGDGYADGKNFPNLPKNETKFSVTVPDLGGKCTEAGVCVCYPRSATDVVNFELILSANRLFSGIGLASPRHTSRASISPFLQLRSL